MISYAGAGRMPRIFNDILAEVISHYLQEYLLRSRKKGLPDT